MGRHIVAVTTTKTHFSDSHATSFGQRERSRILSTNSWRWPYFFVLVCLFVLFAYWKVMAGEAQQRPIETLGNGGHIYDRARQYKENGFLI